MTSRLLLMRHAKSSWDDASASDHDRPLAKRGRSAAERMGAHLKRAGLLPDLVLCSSALRTRQTLERLQLPETDTRFEGPLYGASDRGILAVIHETGGDAETILVLGHNPGMQDLAVDLTGADPGEEASRLRERFPTGALAVFETDEAWRDLAARHARLASFVVPRDLE
jgi:phosphohistidine phosphatase